MTKSKKLDKEFIAQEKEAYEYQEIKDDYNLTETSEFTEHDITEHLELDANSELSIREQLNDITSKCTYKEEYVKNNIILSVNHLKQFFFFGKGPKKYKLKAVHDVNFQIKEGECFGIVGESGCGKTTTGRSIIRLYNITSGSIYYKGYRIGAGSRWNEKEIKYSKIHLKQRLEELKSNLDNGDISEEEYNNLCNEATEHCENICRVQRAKIKQIKYDNKVGGKITVNGDKIDALKQLRKVVISQINEIKHDVSLLVKNGELAPEQFEEEFNTRSKALQDRLTECDDVISELKANNKRIMSEIQMIFQDPIDSLDPRMTVEDIIQEGLKIQGHRNKKENHQKVVEVLEKVGLIADYANRYPHEFSGGQRQRIGIARALIMNPKLLICDEPISALDVSIRAQIINLLNELKEEMGLTIIFIAHDLSVVKYFCDRIAVMYFGEIVELASSDELFKHPLHPYTKSLLSAIPKPNPRTEKNRTRIVYNPQKEHDYTINKPKLVEIRPNHFILANEEELIKYNKEIDEMDKHGVKLSKI